MISTDKLEMIKILEEISNLTSVEPTESHKYNKKILSKYNFCSSEYLKM
jgi:hypothetical protein